MTIIVGNRVCLLPPLVFSDRKYMLYLYHDGCRFIIGAN